MNLFYGLLIILCGHLSIANTNVLDKVVEYRKYKPVEYSLPKELDTSKYKCLVALPFGYKSLIGKRVYFYSMYDKRIHGPWLVVDIEADNHNYMKRNNLIADSSCTEYKSQYGILLSNKE